MLSRVPHHSRPSLALSALGLWTLLCAAAGAQDEAGWRFWLARDSLPESFTRKVALGADGRIWLRHGAVQSATVLDGYVVTLAPEPRTASSTNWSMLRRILAGPDGEAWTVADEALKRYGGSAWEVVARQPPGDQMIDAAPLSPGRALVLFADRVAEYGPAGRAEVVIKTSAAASIGRFVTMVARGGSFWIAGQHGVARIERTADGYQWIDRGTRAIGLGPVETIVPGEDGEVFLTGLVAAPDLRAVARWHGDRLDVIYKANGPLRGWHGPDGTIWIAEGAAIRRLVAGKWETVNRRGSLAGNVYDVATEPGGAFWLATSEGVARYAPPIWRAPAPAHQWEKPVHAITEDRRGRLWFAAGASLIELDGETWRVHPLPPDEITHTIQTENLTALPDGRIAMTTLHPRKGNQLVVFDPARRRFEAVLHPEGRKMDLAWRRRDGTFWVRSLPCRLEVYDGKSFRPFPVEEPVCSRMRYLHEAADGALWFGTSSAGAAVLRGGRMTLFGVANGYPEPGTMVLHERRNGVVLSGGRETLAQFDQGRWPVLRRNMDRARSIMESRNGTLWVASGAGIHRLRDGDWITNGEADGLPSDIANEIFEDSKGRIWAGTSRGLSLYHPDADRDPPSAWMENNPRETAPDGIARVVFAGVDRWKHTSPDRLLFSHRLDGGGWTEFAAEPSALFRGLGAGDHRVEVRALDRNGNVSRPSAPFAFVVAQPWYRQEGFLLIFNGCLAAILALLGFAAAQYRELKRAKQAAEEASRCKSEFLANMSHEIRTPMNAIVGMTDLAQDAARDPAQKECLATVQKASESLLALLNDILDLSKVEAGRVTLSMVDFDLRECVDDCLRTLRVSADEKSLALEGRIGAMVPEFLNGDDHRLRQVLLNLIGNAIKFTEKGRVNVYVTCDADPTGTVAIDFAVCDTGIGVPREKQQLIFAPFEQADSSTTRVHGGTGLGLAISSQLVRLMKGEVVVESPWHDPDTGALVTGSAFRFRVEFGRGARPAVAPSAAHIEAGRPLRVLVAEDNRINQKVVEQLLRRMGHHVVVACDGHDAVEAWRRENVDVILMDVHMPGLDGLQATAIIRAEEARYGGHIPIVALTASALDGDRQKCLDAGMDDYLAKPIHGRDLARALSGFVATPAK